MHGAPPGAGPVWRACVGDRGEQVRAMRTAGKARWRSHGASDSERCSAAGHGEAAACRTCRAQAGLLIRLWGGCMVANQSAVQQASPEVWLGESVARSRALQTENSASLGAETGRPSRATGSRGPSCPAGPRVRQATGQAIRGGEVGRARAFCAAIAAVTSASGGASRIAHSGAGQIGGRWCSRAQIVDLRLSSPPPPLSGSVDPITSTVSRCPAGAAAA